MVARYSREGKTGEKPLLDPRGQEGRRHGRSGTRLMTTMVQEAPSPSRDDGDRTDFSRLCPPSRWDPPRPARPCVFNAKPNRPSGGEPPAVIEGHRFVCQNG